MGQIPPPLVGVGLLGCCRNNHFQKLSRENETWGRLFSQSYILQAAKCHVSESSPGKGAAGALAELEAGPVSRAYFPWWSWVSRASGEIHFLRPLCGSAWPAAAWANAEHGNPAGQESSVDNTREHFLCSEV
uniref:Uncharacterized protein n=1 Tax=Molossus molossus TaxID=27622 RepID=A0A7J8I1J4_MOLMO|nr:hypothetical protein HJG59_010881 [Molossus molossus]